MAVILLTFLGTGRYEPCRYSFATAAEPSDEVIYYSAALAGHLKPDRVVSLETKDAALKHGEALARAFRALGCEHEAVRIPGGASETELWEIFGALTRHVPEGCTLHLDITHGFRSLPVLGFIALSYLRVTRKVTIGGIYYGAWEARDGATMVVPTFQLAPFLTLLDWTAAADQFFSSGSAVRLGELLGQAQQTLWRDPGDLARTELPKKLKTLGKSIRQSSMNLLLLRTGSLRGSGENLAKRIEEAKAEASVFARPFVELLEPVRDQLSRFSGIDLETLRDLVGWLAERGQTAASLTLASEWLTSYVMVVCGETGHHAGYQVRKPYSLAVAVLENPEMEVKRDATGVKAEAIVAMVRSRLKEDQIERLRSAAGVIRSARNDLNHAGFNEGPKDAEGLAERAVSVAEEIRKMVI
jgi:CRISPR-associated DxTHG motif protein